MFLPETQGSQKVFGDVTYEQLNHYLIQADGVLFMLSGLLILINKRKAGALLLVAAMAFILTTKDNPFLQSNLKSIKLEQETRSKNFIKHLGVIGGVLLLLIHQA